MGDFNGDGALDLAVANYASDSVSVLLGKGDGTFQPPARYGVGAYPFSVAVGDFNGDGKPDLAVAKYYSAKVSILSGKGDGTFQAAVHYATGTIPVSVATGDFNRDGKLDLVVANSGSDNASVLLGNGDGTFETAANYTVGSVPVSVAVGDFNGDGKPDLAVANFGLKDPGSGVYTNIGVSVLLGQGDGTFQDAFNYDAGTNPVAVAVSDFNGDGESDIAVGLASAKAGGDGVSVLLGNGDGTFQVAVAAATLGQRLAVGDFNRDGRPDLAVANWGHSLEPPTGGNLSVLLNAGAFAGVHLGVVRSHNTVLLSWPLSDTKFVPESTTSLSAPNWQGASEIRATNSGRAEITVPPDPARRYSRLRNRDVGTTKETN